MKEAPKRSTPSPLPTNNIRELPKRYSPLPTKTVKDLDSNSQKSREVPKGPRNRKIKTFQVARIDRKPQFKSKRHRRKIYDEFFGTTTKYSFSTVCFTLRVFYFYVVYKHFKDL